MNGWLIFLGLLAAYMLLVVWLVRSGRMEKWNLSLLLGFILMIRTQRGRGALAALARPARLWNFIGDFGIVLVTMLMMLITVSMVALLPGVLSPSSPVRPLAASEVFIIPGVTPYLPLSYGLIGLIVTLVVHEGGHGVLAIANKMKVKSVGLLFAIAPIGAFVEPDEEEMMASSLRARLRVYAAGPTINVLVAAGTMAIFAAMVASTTVVPGATIAGIVADSPASDSGLEGGDAIIGASGTAFADWGDFTGFMANQTAGDEVVFDLHRGATATVVLGSRWDALSQTQQDAVLEQDEQGRAICEFYLEEDGDGEYEGDALACSNGLTQLAFLGVNVFPADVYHEALANPVSDFSYFMQYVSMPLQEVLNDFPLLTTYIPAFMETPFDADIFWPLANVVFWIFWINLMVGITNTLPVSILDGGQLFRDGLGGIIQKLRPRMEEERRNRIVMRAVGFMSLLILGVFLLQILGPRFTQGLA